MIRFVDDVVRIVGHGLARFTRGAFVARTFQLGRRVGSTGRAVVHPTGGQVIRGVFTWRFYQSLPVEGTAWRELFFSELDTVTYESSWRSGNMRGFWGKPL